MHCANGSLSYRKSLETSVRCFGMLIGTTDSHLSFGVKLSSCQKRTILTIHLNDSYVGAPALHIPAPITPF